MARPPASLAPRCAPRPAASIADQSANAHFFDRRAQFKAFVLIEVVFWLPALYLACYRFQPTVRFVETPTGQRVVSRASELLERYTPRWYSDIARLGARVYGSSRGRSFAEFLLLNKVLAPVALPAKLWLAHEAVERQTKSAANRP